MCSFFCFPGFFSLVPVLVVLWVCENKKNEAFFFCENVLYFIYMQDYCTSVRQKQSEHFSPFLVGWEEDAPLDNAALLLGNSNQLCQLHQLLLLLLLELLVCALRLSDCTHQLKEAFVHTGTEFG